MIALEWICDHLNDKNIVFSFIFINSNDSEIEQYARSKSFKYLRIKGGSKLNLLKGIFTSSLFLLKNRTNVIHCHLFEANIVGLISAYIARVPVRIYTRHHSTYHHDYFPKSVKYDKLCNFLSTQIIAISNNVQSVLIYKEKVSEKKISLIPHGFLVEYFTSVSSDRIVRFKNKYHISSNDIIIGIVSRYTKWKGIQDIIPAFLKLLKKYPYTKLLLANSLGNDKEYIASLLSEIPKENIIEIPYENDMAALYKSLSIYVHTPINDHCEAFGQTYVEAIMSGIPSIYTLSGIAKEFIVHQKNAYVVDYGNSNEIYNAMIYYLENPETANQIKERGFLDVVQKFHIEKMIISLKELYLV